ncbi:MAG: RNA polymerase sigma-70 factor [Bacteroidetes bacterium]|nr:MAG: RNA polymerase sigma-70 factor [Bacteroidota bacterium]
MLPNPDTCPQIVNTGHTEDNELWQRIKRDDNDALKTLFYSHFKTLAAIGQRISGDPDEGKDIAQKVFIQLWEKRDTIHIEGDIRSYLKRMAINEALAQKRTVLRKQELQTNIEVANYVNPDGEEQVIAGELQESVDRAVEALPEKCGEVFKLSRYEDLSYKEIGETLNISVKTVESHMGRALRQLREALKTYMSIFF